jgi:hypothetical protein
MADLTITGTNVVAGTNATTKQGIAGEVLTAGQAVYQKAADSKIYKAKCSGTPEEATVKGIALNGASAGQSVLYQSSGNMNIGAAATIKTTTYLLSAAYGGVCPQADITTTGQRVVVIGYATDLVGNMLLDINNTGVTL